MTNELLEDRLRETYAEHDASYDPEPALERLHARSRSLDAGRHAGRWPAMPAARVARSRPRVALALAGVLAACAVALSSVLAGGGMGGVGVASAQQVVARTAAAIARSGRGVLHVDAVTTYTGGGKRVSYEIDRWSEQTHPYRYWATARTAQETEAETLVGNRDTVYTSKGNRILIGTLARVGQIPDPLLTAIQTLNTPSAADPSQIAITDKDGNILNSIGTIKLFSRTLKEIAPHVTVDRHATLHGIPAISITAANHWSTLYVHPGTYAPLGMVVTGPSEADARTTVFKTYATLPVGSVRIPNLIKEHPHATVVGRG